jgi:molybdate transport system permease protein
MLDRAFGNAARSLGEGEWRIFLRVVLPLGWKTVVAATAAGFARVLIEWTIVAAL